MSCHSVRSQKFRLQAAERWDPVFSPFFAGTGKNRYQRLALNYLTQIARMPDNDMEVLGKVLRASWEEREFASVALDEIMEMFNRVIKQSLTKVSQAYMVKLAPIVEHRRVARSQVLSIFYKPTEERDAVSVVVKDRHTAVQQVMPFVKTSRIFSDDGKGMLVSLSGMVASKDVTEGMINARSTSFEAVGTGVQNTSDEGNDSHVCRSKHDINFVEGSTG